MKNKKYMHIRTKEIVTAYEMGISLYNGLFDRLFDDEEITEEQYKNPIYPDREDLIIQGISFLQDNCSYKEVK